MTDPLAYLDEVDARAAAATEGAEQMTLEMLRQGGAK